MEIVPRSKWIEILWKLSQEGRAFPQLMEMEPRKKSISTIMEMEGRRKSISTMNDSLAFFQKS